MGRRALAVVAAFLAAGLMATAAGAVEDSGANAAGAAGPAGAVPERRLTIAVLDDAPPFSSAMPFGSRTGFDVDLAHALCARVGARCTLLPLRPEDLLPALADRRVDAAVASPLLTARGGAPVEFTDAYLSLSVRAVTRREEGAGRPVAAHPAAARTAGEGGAEDGQGERTDGAPAPAASATPRRLAALAGSPEAEHLRTNVAGAVALYSEPEEMWIDLALGRLEAVVVPAVIARGELLSTPLGRPFRFAPAGSAVAAPPRTAAIAVRAGEATLLQELDGALDEILADPLFDEMLERHLPPDLAGRPAAAPAASPAPAAPAPGASFPPRSAPQGG